MFLIKLVLIFYIRYWHNIVYQKIIIRPILTEKIAIMQERQNKYGFIVSGYANKVQIKSAIESKFDVVVLKVATMNFNGKLKQMTTKSNGKTIRTQGRRASFKKAIVTLKDGDVIDYVNSGAES